MSFSSFQAKPTESDYFHLQSSNMSGLSLQNHAELPNRLTRTRPVSTMDEQWKKSSANDGWKTSSSSLNTKTKQESWKMSGKPRHAQVKQLVNDDPRSRRQSATATMMHRNSLWRPSSSLSTNPLPQEPCMTEPFNLVYHGTPAPLHDTAAPFHINTPMMGQQSPAFIPTNNTADYPLPPPQLQTNIYTTSDMMYPTPNPPVMILPNAIDYQQPEYPNYIHSGKVLPLPPLITDQLSIYSPNSSIMSQAPLPTTTPALSTQDTQTTINSPPKPFDTNKNNKKKEKPEKKIRQITVQSVNIEHRAWIDVLPSETGLSLAEKIHIIATFRTRKIVSITTASGRKVPLDNRPVFGSWMDMENFVDGERWAVEWRENDRGVVDRFLSRVVQAGGGKRKDHVVKEKD